MNIYVGNLSLEMTEDELRQRFTDFGQVKSVTLMNDIYIGSGQPRGYGFVEMFSKIDGETAIKNLNGITLRGQAIKVIEALPLSDIASTQSSRSKGARNLYRKARQRGDSRQDGNYK